MSTHTFDEKLLIVSQFHAGRSIRSLSHAHCIRRDTILAWVRQYDLFGESGLRKRPPICATPDLKESLVRLVLEKSLSLSLISVQHGVAINTLRKWVRTVKLHGAHVLYEEKPLVRPINSMGRPKKRIPETELEKLQAENLRLRAENALLKKVRALVLEKEARERMLGQKPSKN